MRNKGIIKRAIYICIFAIFMHGCSSTFIVYKEGKGYYLGSAREELNSMLCERGDFRRVLERTSLLSSESKESLFRYVCLEPDRDRLKKLLSTFTEDQRRDLKTSFRKEGYDINLVPCA